MGKVYSEHRVFDKLSKFSEFYNDLSYSIMPFASMGVRSIVNIDTYIYTSMQGTLESIRGVLEKGRISDAYALLRKYYDAAIINIYINLYLDENSDTENLVVEKIEEWRTGKAKLPNKDIRSMNNYLQKSEKVAEIYRLLHKDKRYSELRERCNDNTHYSFYYNILLNDNKVHLENRNLVLDVFSNDLEDIFTLHLSYLFYIKENYMMSSDYIDNLDIGIAPEPDSQYLVAPFVQEIFDSVIKKNRMDLAMEIKRKTIIFLE